MGFSFPLDSRSQTKHKQKTIANKIGTSRRQTAPKRRGDSPKDERARDRDRNKDRGGGREKQKAPEESRGVRGNRKYDFRDDTREKERRERERKERKRQREREKETTPEALRILRKGKRNREKEAIRPLAIKRDLKVEKELERDERNGVGMPKTPQTVTTNRHGSPSPIMMDSYRNDHANYNPSNQSFPR